MKMTRQWAMPSPDTFSIPPVREFIDRYYATSKLSIDPFARNSLLANHRNDLNPETRAQSHMDAEAWLKSLQFSADLMFFDPPYSPRQISEVYQQIGRAVGTADTQNAALYRRVRDAAMRVLLPESIVLSFGWNSSGMGRGRGFEIVEIALICHGGAHNDTICLAERRLLNPQHEFSL